MWPCQSASCTITRFSRLSAEEQLIRVQDRADLERTGWLKARRGVPVSPLPRNDVLLRSKREREREREREKEEEEEEEEEEKRCVCWGGGGRRGIFYYTYLSVFVFSPDSTPPNRTVARLSMSNNLSYSCSK